MEDNPHGREFMKRLATEEFDWEDGCAHGLTRLLGPSSVLDAGCGIGRWIAAAVGTGCNDVLGIDTNVCNVIGLVPDKAKGKVVFGDLSKILRLRRKFDCVWSFGVAEHLPPESSLTFALNLVNHSSRLVVVTAAPPRRGGVGPVNCKEKHEWIDMFQRAGGHPRTDLELAVISAWMPLTGRPDSMVKDLMVFDTRPVSPELRRASMERTRMLAAKGLV